jgi:hypothetical protein
VSCGLLICCLVAFGVLFARCVSLLGTIHALRKWKALERTIAEKRTDAVAKTVAFVRSCDDSSAVHEWHASVPNGSLPNEARCMPGRLPG